MNKNLVLMALAVLALGLSACDNKAKTESTSESTDANGTTVEKSVESETTVNDDGTATTETDTKKTVDPEGVLNKETTETHTEETK